MERGLASRGVNWSKHSRNWCPHMTAAHASGRGLVDLGTEADRSWQIIWETFGKLRPSSTERTQGSAVRKQWCTGSTILRWPIGNFGKLGQHLDETRVRFRCSPDWGFYLKARSCYSCYLALGKTRLKQNLAILEILKSCFIKQDLALEILL